MAATKKYATKSFRIIIDSYYLEDLKETYNKLKSAFELLGKPLPVNKAKNKTDDLIIRRLDCAVIQAHVTDSSIKYDSVRGVFWEGNDLYLGAGIKEKNHIQICVRDINCVKGFFIPREQK